MKTAKDLSIEEIEILVQFVRSWAWTGSNGSPFTEEQAKRLQTQIQNDAWRTLKQIGIQP